MAVALALAATGGLAVPEAKARYENVVPEDTYAAIQIRDVPTTYKNAANHPFVEDFEKLLAPDAPFAALAEAFTKEWKKPEKQDELKIVRGVLDEFKKGELASGEVFVGFVNARQKDGSPGLAVVVIAETHYTLEKLCDLIKACKPERSEALDKDLKNARMRNGFKCLLDGDDFSAKETEGKVNVAVGNGLFVVATNTAHFGDLLDSISEKRLPNGKKSLGETSQWKNAVAAAGNPDYFVFGNITPWIPLLREQIVKEVKKSETKKTKPKGENAGKGKKEDEKEEDDEDDDDEDFLQSLRAFAVDVVAAYDTLALDVLESFWFAGEITQADMRGRYALAFKERRGLLTLDASKPLADFPPPFIPDDAEIYWDVMRFDFSKSWQNFEILLSKALPTLKPMLDGHIGQLKAKEGIDLRGDVFENIGEYIYQIWDFSRGGNLSLEKYAKANDPEQAMLSQSIAFLYAIQLRDAAKFNSLLDTAIGKLGKGGAEAIFSEREFMGVKIRAVKESQDSEVGSVSYAIHDGTLFLSMMSDSLLEKVIAAKQKSYSPASQNRTVRKAASLLPKGVFSMGFLDMDSTANFMLKLFKVMAQLEEKRAKTEGTADAENLNLKSKRPAKTKKELETIKIFTEIKPLPRGSFPWAYTWGMRSNPNDISVEVILFRKDVEKK